MHTRMPGRALHLRAYTAFYAAHACTTRLARRECSPMDNSYHKCIRACNKTSPQ
jgi:hypothetical protein